MAAKIIIKPKKKEKEIEVEEEEEFEETEEEEEKEPEEEEEFEPEEEEEEEPEEEEKPLPKKKQKKVVKQQFNKQKKSTTKAKVGKELFLSLLQKNLSKQGFEIPLNGCNTIQEEVFNTIRQTLKNSPTLKLGFFFKTKSLKKELYEKLTDYAVGVSAHKTILMKPLVVGRKLKCYMKKDKNHSLILDEKFLKKMGLTAKENKENYSLFKS